MPAPRISVITPVYQAAPYLADCLASLCGQTLEDFELLLIDDGSTDESPAICDGWAQKDSRIRVWHRRNAGPGAARNFGLENARGAYVAFVDGDDLLPPYALHALAEAAKKGVDIVSALHEEFDPDGTTRLFYPCLNTDDRMAILRSIIVGDSVYNITCNKLYRREFLKKNGIRQAAGVRIGEDALMNLSAYALADQIAHVNAVTYRYRIHPQSAMRRQEQAGEFDGHLPYLTALRPRLSALGLRDQTALTYLFSFTLRLHRQRGFGGVFRTFRKDALPAVLDGLCPRRLGPFQRLVLRLCRMGLFPFLWLFILPVWGKEYALKFRYYGRRFKCRP